MHPLFVTYREGPAEWGVALVDVGGFPTYSEAAEALYSEHRRRLTNIDVLIIRAGVQVQVHDESAESGELDGFRDRVPRASLHLLYSNDFEIKVSENLNPNVGQPGFVGNGIRDWLRQTELASFVDQSSARFEARDNYVFRSPSGSYCRVFLRVGNVQTERSRLDAFFFWMLPYLRETEALLTETWSISSIALNAAYRVSRYAPGRDRFDIDMLNSYHDGAADQLPETIEVLSRIGRDGRRVLVLLSAVATARSLERLRETIRRTQIDPDRFSFLSLYKMTSSSEIDTLCDLTAGDSEGSDAVVMPAEAVRASNPTVLDIDRKTYFPLQVLDTTLRIDGAAATPARPFFNQYKGRGVIALHRDSVDSNGLVLRHHGIHIDVERMLGIEYFFERFEQILKGLPSIPTLIIVPPHNAGMALATAARETFRAKAGDEPEIVIHPDLHPSDGGTPKRLISHFSVDDAVLVLDDASVTGQRLARFQKHLRDLEFRGRILYVVGVARPESERDWNLRTRNLRYRSDRRHEGHIVECVEKVVLPDWDDRLCPWCRELRSLRMLMEEPTLLGASVGLLSDRLNTLVRARPIIGLGDNGIWSTGGVLRLTPNSLFLEHDGATGADVIAAVAAAIQQLRTASGANKLEAAYPHISVIDDSDYFGETFTDDILRLAIIRACQKRELEHWSDAAEERRRRAVREQFRRGDSDREVVWLELAVALLDQKLPRVSLADDEWEVVRESQCHDLLRQILA